MIIRETELISLLHSAYSNKVKTMWTYNLSISCDRNTVGIILYRHSSHKNSSKGSYISKNRVLTLF